MLGLSNYSGVRLDRPYVMSELFVQPYSHYIISYMLSFLMIFRVQLSYQRYWDGLEQLCARKRANATRKRTTNGGGKRRALANKSLFEPQHEHLEFVREVVAVWMRRAQVCERVEARRADAVAGEVQVGVDLSARPHPQQ